MGLSHFPSALVNCIMWRAESFRPVLHCLHFSSWNCTNCSLITSVGLMKLHLLASKGNIEILKLWRFNNILEYFIWYVANGSNRSSLLGRYCSPSCCKSHYLKYGEARFSTLWGSQTPERISIKPRIYNQVVGSTTHAKLGGAATTWVVSANTWHVTCFGFFSDLFLLYRYSSDRAPPEPMHRLWRLIRQMASFRARMCFLGVPLMFLPIFGVKPLKTAPKEARIGNFQPKYKNH